MSSSKLWPDAPGAGPVPVSPKVDFPALDHAVLKLWDERQVFARTIRERNDCPDFVAYDGPPGTNGEPHIGHMMQSALKDLWPRYYTMKGFRVRRKAGWDTHGLPIELTAEKELGFKSKRDIENYGIERYIQYCRSTVYRYKDAWSNAIRRIGRFLDTDDYYATLTDEYIQTDWWVLKQAWEKGLLYEGHRIMPYCCRCGTSLSQHETAQGYQDIQDISLYVKFPIAGQPDTFFVAWTTTPWTLLSNVALAVNPVLGYVTVKTSNNEHLILAESCLDAVKSLIGDNTIIERQKGSILGGTKYLPLWNFQKDDKAHWVVVDDYVTALDGSGIVHLALYGEDDFRLIRKNNLPMVQNVDSDGKCTSNTGPFAGRWFREEGLDLDILKELASRGLLLGKEKITHSYPHCYRCDTPLMYFAMSGWFLKTSAFKDRMLAANQDINWYPDHIKDGRFGNWLENNVDWNISRNRYWGSPLPIWTCQKCKHQVCAGSLKELAELLGKPLAPDFDPHKPYIDRLTLPCPKCAGSMRRTPEVLDSWFNAGIMPWGQWGYPKKPGSMEMFQSQFPADFICEAIDQTRGWFYTMLAASVMLTMEKNAGTETRATEDISDSNNAGTETRVMDETKSNGQWGGTPCPPETTFAGTESRATGKAEISSASGDACATGFSNGVSSFKNVICTELILDKDGFKMSKSRGNVVKPVELCDKYGADMVRWLFYRINPWTVRRFNEDELPEALKQVLIPYWNAYSFFVTYARVDRWKPSKDVKAPLKLLDRWVFSRLECLQEGVEQALDTYDVTSASEAIEQFLDELTNWFIRRSRRRFWKSEDDADKQAAYTTLYTTLTRFNRILSPFLPFTTEAVYQNLECAFDPGVPDSVHLAGWPRTHPNWRDMDLEKVMGQVRKIVSAARSLRNEGGVRVRQPLSELVFSGESEGLAGEFEHLILDELNIKHLRYVRNAKELFTYRAKPNFKSLGPKFGSRVKTIAAAVSGLTDKQIQNLLQDGRLLLNEAVLEAADCIVESVPLEGYWVRSEDNLTVAVKYRITEELRLEWLAREFVHHAQNLRREADLEVTDRIRIEYNGAAELQKAVSVHKDYIKTETLALNIDYSEGVNITPATIGDQPAGLVISKVAGVK